MDNVALAQVQTLQVKWVFGPLCNPFYVGSNSLLTGCGYAFLIVLWWDRDAHIPLFHWPELGSRWLFGWQTLISVMYFALGLASMLAIQACWNKLGMEAYRAKWISGFIGIPIGAFLPPPTRLGAPVFG